MSGCQNCKIFNTDRSTHAYLYPCAVRPGYREAVIDCPDYEFVERKASIPIPYITRPVFNGDYITKDAGLPPNVVLSRVWCTPNGSRSEMAIDRSLQRCPRFHYIVVRIGAHEWGESRDGRVLFGDQPTGAVGLPISFDYRPLFGTFNTEQGDRTIKIRADHWFSPEDLEEWDELTRITQELDSIADDDAGDRPYRSIPREVIAESNFDAEI